MERGRGRPGVRVSRRSRSPQRHSNPRRSRCKVSPHASERRRNLNDRGLEHVNGVETSATDLSGARLCGFILSVLICTFAVTVWIRTGGYRRCMSHLRGPGQVGTHHGRTDRRGFGTVAIRSPERVVVPGRLGQRQSPAVRDYPGPAIFGRPSRSVTPPTATGRTWPDRRAAYG